MWKKKGRRSYLNDYRRNEQGAYEYGGRRYSYCGTDLRRKKLLLSALCAAACAAMAAAGCIPAPGMGNCIYVLLPYAAGLAAGGGMCLALYRVCTGGDPMKAYVFEAGVQKLPARAAVTAVCAVLASAGEIVFAARSGFGGRGPGFAAFLFLELTAVGSALLVRKNIQKMHWI